MSGTTQTIEQPANVPENLALVQAPVSGLPSRDSVESRIANLERIRDEKLKQADAKAKELKLKIDAEAREAVKAEKKKVDEARNAEKKAARGAFKAASSSWKKVLKSLEADEIAAAPEAPATPETVTP
jgi:hypothetical protein